MLEHSTASVGVTGFFESLASGWGFFLLTTSLGLSMTPGMTSDDFTYRTRVDTAIQGADFAFWVGAICSLQSFSTEGGGCG